MTTKCGLGRSGQLPPPPTVRPDKAIERFALDADITVYWPWVRPCWEDQGDDE